VLALGDLQRDPVEQAKLPEPHARVPQVQDRHPRRNPLGRAPGQAAAGAGDRWRGAGLAAAGSGIGHRLGLDANDVGDPGWQVVFSLRRHHHPDAFAVELIQNLEQATAMVGVQASDRVIEQQQARPAQHGSREHEAMELAVRQGGHRPLQKWPEAETRDLALPSALVVVAVRGVHHGERIVLLHEGSLEQPPHGGRAIDQRAVPAHLVEVARQQPLPVLAHRREGDGPGR